ncbi:guanylate kinase [Enterococcus sp. PF1-24]|uniref:guanylate kinase n=1 Tax=unclassified Enterococcus TaxID=2608891 RepID=UPI00247704DD|nr:MULTISPECIES: AAA family ATPase [unclassified Enterococcus]MDH6364188.1 guanylate kinase [Enterococcus sp. PFB1-1]MDH6401289.1 guanylate kinase [Enterococcus sp. PF1-24]
MTNHCYIFIGPSGSGKTTLTNQLFSEKQKIISHTTRAPRPAEIAGKDYYFISEKEFKTLIATEAFAEYDCYQGDYYGVTKKELTDKLAAADCYNVLTLKGFLTLAENDSQQAILPVLLTANQATLQQRLSKRGDAEEIITKRLASAEAEMLSYKILDNHPKVIRIDANQSLTSMILSFKEQVQQA